ncbi:MAG: response regulator transcription factor [Chitinophagaceae bacterium]|nr:response regulator transcription factor [Anaerolineae bacterium]
MSKTIRILVADDHAVVRAGLRALLERREDFRVIAEAATGEEAIARAFEWHPDVIVMDIRMPGISGIEATRQIIEKIPGARIIILTSYAEDDLLFAAIRAGAVGYVLKRIGDNDLVNAVERVSRGESMLDPAMTATVFDQMKKAQESQQAAAFKGLTSQEMSILGLISQGLTNRQISVRLFIGEGTTRNYVSSLLSKLSLSNRAEAAAYAIRNGIQEILPPNDKH